jgi:hypothetical protein
MKPPLHLTLIGCLSLCLLGCDSKPAEPVALEKSAPAAAPAPVAAATEYKPEYAVAIEQSSASPKTWAVTYSAKVNTGGWTLKPDSVLVEEHNGMMACRIYATLEQPSPSSVVTQAFETITNKYDAGTVEIGRVEFSVRRKTAGMESPYQPMYSVVKSIKYPY